MATITHPCSTHPSVIQPSFHPSIPPSNHQPSILLSIHSSTWSGHLSSFLPSFHPSIQPSHPLTTQLLKHQLWVSTVTGTGNLTWTLPPCPRLTVQWGTHKGKDSAGLPPKHTLRQGMKTVHLEDGSRETTMGEGRNESGKGRHSRRDAHLEPHPAGNLQKEGSRSVPRGVIPAGRPRSRGRDALPLSTTGQGLLLEHRLH